MSYSLWAYVHECAYKQSITFFEKKILGNGEACLATPIVRRQCFTAIKALLVIQIDFLFCLTDV